MRKRVFFAFQIEAPWPKELPQGRLLDERSRHLTIAFIGAVEYAPFAEALSSFPPPPFQVGLTGYFDKIKFLPPRRANVASWHVQWHDEAGQLGQYQRQIAEWLESYSGKQWMVSGDPLPFKEGVISWEIACT